MHRMQCKNGGRKPGARNIESPQKEPQQKCICGVDQYVDQVVAKRIDAPESVLDPNDCAPIDNQMRSKPSGA